MNEWHHQSSNKTNSKLRPVIISISDLLLSLVKLQRAYSLASAWNGLFCLCAKKFLTCYSDEFFFLSLCLRCCFYFLVNSHHARVECFIFMCWCCLLSKWSVLLAIGMQRRKVDRKRNVRVSVKLTKALKKKAIQKCHVSGQTTFYASTQKYPIT